MALIPWRPIREFMALEDEMSRLFDSFFGRSLRPWRREEVWSPLLDIRDTGDSLIAEIDLPGINPKDVDISVEGRTLSIKGERKAEKEVTEGGYSHYERYLGSFQRMVTLSDEIDPERTKASYKDGVLTITMPKAEKTKAKKIKIE